MLEVTVQPHQVEVLLQPETAQVTTQTQQFATTVTTQASAAIVPPQALQVTPQPQTVAVIETAEQGPAGPPGPGGASSPGEQAFTGQMLVTVDHNRGYHPLVMLSNLTGSEIEGAIEHPSLNRFTVLFNVPQSGLVTYF